MTLPLSTISGLHAAGAAKSPEPVDPKTLQAARDFEAIFLRSLLSSLEKTTAVAGNGKPSTSQSTYGSMVVGALADSISGSGGIGLADLIAKSLSAHLPHPSAEPKPPK
jgi:Rod binding domain-containing protein